MLNDRTLNWVVESVGRNFEVHSTKRLLGGISAEVYEVQLSVGKVIVKQYKNKSWLLEEPDLAQNEMENLQFIQQINVPTPVPIAVDVDGELTGFPSVLMTKLDGDIQLMPDDFDVWTSNLAKTLASIHQIDVTDFPRMYLPYTSVDEIGVPIWSSQPEEWERAVRIVKEMPPETKQSFIHRDFHPTNVLWQNDNVSGVVDWVNACRGPSNVDVGHCRINHALLYGVEAADDFLEAYLKVASSEFNYQPYWDLLSIIDFIDIIEPPTVYEGWVALGITSLSDEMMRNRMDSYLCSVLSL